MDRALQAFGGRDDRLAVNEEVDDRHHHRHESHCNADQPVEQVFGLVRLLVGLGRVE